MSEKNRDQKDKEEKQSYAQKAAGSVSGQDISGQEPAAQNEEQQDGKRPKETKEDLERLSGTALENRIFQAIDYGEVDVFQICYPRHEPDRYWDSKIDMVVNETHGDYEKLPTGIRVYLLPIHIGYLCKSPNPELEELSDTLGREMKRSIPDRERTVFLEETLRRMMALDDRYLRDKLKCIVALYDSLDQLDDNRYIEKWQNTICKTVCDYLREKPNLLEKAVRYSGTDDYPEMLAAELKIESGQEDPDEEDPGDEPSSKKWILTAVIGVIVVVLAVCYVVAMHGNGNGNGSSNNVVVSSSQQGARESSAAGTANSGTTESGTSGQSSEPAVRQETADTAAEVQTEQTAQSEQTAEPAATSDTADTSESGDTQTQGQVDMSDVPSEGETMSITQTYTVYTEMNEDDSKRDGEVISGYSVIVDQVYDTGWIRITYYTGSPLTEHTGYIKYR